MPRERRAAGNDQPHAPSEPLLELGEHELVEEGRRAGQLDPCAQRPQLAPEPPVEEQRLDAAGLGDLCRGSGINPVEDARDAEEERGPQCADVVDEVLDVACVFGSFFVN